MTSHEIRSPARGRATLTAVAAAVLATVCAAPALASSAAPRAEHAQTARADDARGTLLSVTAVQQASKEKVVEVIAGNKVDASAVRYGISSYRLTYATITPTGKPTTASALLVLPDGGGKRLATVAEHHGTTVYRGDAPSMGDSYSSMGAWLYASGGRAVVAPDYLGLGTGPGNHPYVDTKSSVSASIDALRAGRTAAAEHGRTLTRDVHVTGFSQGGQVSVAVARELSRGADRHFRPRSLAPIAGPYDIAGQELPAIFDGRIDDTSAVYYLSYFLTAQNKLHPLYKDPREVFRQPYASTVETLFDNDHTETEILKDLAPNVKALLTDEWSRHIQHPTGTLAKVLELNDGACDWAPKVPVRLHASTGDRDVPIGNTTSCVKTLAEHGVRAKVINHGDSDHLATYKKAIGHNANWYARLR
ncbi:alpha/beta hydrolase family protein [Streptomyces zagrosensis]|uniref:Dienelactone hydrolase n=1 Tax=Streptomyces zagrosensis TaxID=1042984 RepID=A0A7W9UYC4_9ACTN|nr:alpha/beta fold hydrolase [Streptomyces zagrosensis]MBB5935805.1 dienelactone hydrolase [Streptomyces zagrosensis]